MLLMIGKGLEVMQIIDTQKLITNTWNITIV